MAQSINIRVLTPNKGNYFTQAGEVEILERIISEKVYLGKFDSPENWKEITEQEAEDIKAEQQEVLEAQAKECAEKEVKE